MKIKQILATILFSILLIVTIGSKPSYGLDNPGGLVKWPDSFISKGNRGNTVIDKENVKNVVTPLYNILLVIATIIAVGIISILGIRYMLGSAEGKAEIKNSLVPFIIGCIVVFGSFTIWKIVILMTENL